MVLKYLTATLINTRVGLEFYRPTTKMVANCYQATTKLLDKDSKTATYNLLLKWYWITQLLLWLTHE